MMKHTIDQIKVAIDQIDAEIEDLEQRKRVLENWTNQLIYPEMDLPDWSKEGSNILKSME